MVCNQRNQTILIVLSFSGKMDPESKTAQEQITKLKKEINKVLSGATQTF